MIDQIGGWSVNKVGSFYGNGYSLIKLIKVLNKIVKNWIFLCQWCGKIENYLFLKNTIGVYKLYKIAYPSQCKCIVFSFIGINWLSYSVF